MGCICSHLCCCCPWCQDDDEENQFKSSHRNSGGQLRKGLSPKMRFRATDDDIETEEATAEAVHPTGNVSFRAGESAYSVQKKRFLRDRKKDSGVQSQDPDVVNFLNKNDYTMLGKLGSGSYSEVFQLKKKEKSYAFKMIDLQKVPIDYKTNFLGNEINVLQKIHAKKSKHIIKIYQILETSRKVLIVMEYAAKGTLADHLRESGALSEFAAKQWFSKILDAIVYLHGMRVAHRDLKLENILLTKKSRPKLSDFSYAIEVKPESPLSRQFCGSIPYFPPEILQHKPHNPLIADIWSLGVCFFIMLNDKLPFDLNDESLMLRQQLNKQWKHRKNVEPILSQELKNVIAWMLEPDIDRRATAKQLSANPWFNSTAKSPKEKQTSKSSPKRSPSSRASTSPPKSSHKSSRKT